MHLPFGGRCELLGRSCRLHAGYSSWMPVSNTNLVTEHASIIMMQSLPPYRTLTEGGRGTIQRRVWSPQTTVPASDEPIRHLKCYCKDWLIVAVPPSRSSSSIILVLIKPDGLWVHANWSKTLPSSMTQGHHRHIDPGKSQRIDGRGFVYKGTVSTH